jgi:hypothetical protein
MWARPHCGPCHSTSHAPAFPRRVAPEFCFEDATLLEKRGRREGRELASPMARLQQRTQAAGTTGSAQDIPTFPARWCYDLYALFPGTGCLAPVAGEFVIRLLGISTGMPEPRDFTVASDRSSARKNRAATRHAHRIPHPTSVTIAKRPLGGTGCADQTTISEKQQLKYFCEMGWTGRFALRPLEKSAFRRGRLVR